MVHHIFNVNYLPQEPSSDSPCSNLSSSITTIHIGDAKGATSLPVKEVQLTSSDPRHNPLMTSGDPSLTTRDPSSDLPRDRHRSGCVSPVQDRIEPLPPERRSSSRERLRIDRSPGKLWVTTNWIVLWKKYFSSILWSLENYIIKASIKVCKFSGNHNN